MVGVAGRSKGCVTCRKRKKGCDLRRPACGQCFALKIRCEGYELDRVFVPSKHASRWMKCQNSTSDLVAVTASTFQAMPSSLAQTAFKTKGVEAVFELFPSRHGAEGAFLGNQFWQLMASLSIREEALRQTITAIGLVTLGKGSNDQAVLRKGRVIYGNALHELASSLSSPGRRTIEGLIATTRLMCLFEILYGDNVEKSMQGQNWMSHAQGETALIVSRRPEAFTADPAHLLFTLTRYNAVIIGIRSRRHVIFNEEQWKTVPWQGRDKPASETIIDIFLELPGILGELDHLDDMLPNDERFDNMRLAMITKCWNVHCNLNAWMAKNSNEVYTPQIHAPINIDFPNLSVATVSLRYWAVATLLYQSLDRALHYSAKDAPSLYLNHPHSRLFARLILRSTSWLFQEDNGAIGPSTISFPLGVAMMYIRQNEVPDFEYTKLVFAAWSKPGWPSSIRSFLGSMSNKISLPTRSPTTNPVTWSISELRPVVDIDGNLLGERIEKPSRL